MNYTFNFVQTGSYKKEIKIGLVLRTGIKTKLKESVNEIAILK